VQEQSAAAPDCELQRFVTSWFLGAPESECSYWKVTQLAVNATPLSRYVGIQLSVWFFSLKAKDALKIARNQHLLLKE